MICTFNEGKCSRKIDKTVKMYIKKLHRIWFAYFKMKITFLYFQIVKR